MPSKIIIPNEFYRYSDGKATVFLAGTIENGKSVDWQQRAIDKLSDVDIVIFNPRLKQPPADLVAQIEWEQYHLLAADYVLFHFEPDSISPITLMEFGQIVQTNSRYTYVSCPKGYFRRTNVEVVCNLNIINIYESLDEMLEGFINDNSIDGESVPV